ncbi:MAG: GGDEF domain-containing protein [Gemmatimonadota bacterium]
MSFGSLSIPASEISRAITAACRQAHSETDLYEGCRGTLVQIYGTEAIWLTVGVQGSARRVGPAALEFEDAVQVFHCRSGETDLTVHVLPGAVEQVRDSLPHVCFGLSVALEIRGVLLERQAALDDAAFQLRAMRQVVRLLSSVHSTEETEQLVHDFMAEVFFAWWAVMYRIDGEDYVPTKSRTLAEGVTFDRFERRALDRVLPPGSPVSTGAEVDIARLIPTGTELVVPLDAGGERLALMMLGPRLNQKPYGRPEAELAGTLALAAAIALKNAELIERLRSAATTDGLTGLLNRRAIEERLEAEVSRSARHQVQTTVALIDLDRFKLINDTLGHAAGDRYLVHIGELLQRHVRALDVPGRLGGDEFLVILPMTSVVEARVFAERLRTGLASFSRAHPEFGFGTLSIGLAEAPRDGTTVAEILSSADAALYAAKGGGRDLVRDVTEA